MQIICFFFRQMLNFAIPLMLVALGGMFSVQSGVSNIGLEGIMTIGAFFSLLFLQLTSGILEGQLQLVIAIIIACISGMAISLVHAVAAVNLKANQFISAMAINTFAPAFSLFTARVILGISRIDFVNTFIIEKIPFLAEIPVIGYIFFQKSYILTYLGILIFVASAVILFKTRFGLRLRACGEHPQAADSVGINVAKYRYAGVLISGALAGLGGLAFVIPNSTNFNGTVSGYGFLALGIMMLGEWTPFRIMLASCLFSSAMTLASTYSALPFFSTLGIPSNYYKMIPYVVTLIILAVAHGGTKEPKAAGQPFEKGMR